MFFASGTGVNEGSESYSETHSQQHTQESFTVLCDSIFDNARHGVYAFCVQRADDVLRYFLSVGGEQVQRRGYARRTDGAKRLCGAFRLSRRIGICKGLFCLRLHRRQRSQDGRRYARRGMRVYRRRGGAQQIERIRSFADCGAARRRTFGGGFA